MMSNEVWAAIIGGVVGSLLAGLISFALQLTAQKSARADQLADRKSEELSRNQSLVRAMLFKMTAIRSHLEGVRGMLAQARAEAENAGRQFNWDRLPPFGNVPSEVHFSTDEMAMLFALGDNELFNATMLCDERHNAAMAFVSLYSRRRVELTDLLASSVGFNAISTGRQNELNSLMQMLETNIAAELSATKRCLVALAKIASDRLKVPIEIALKDAAGTGGSAPPQPTPR